MAGVSIDIELQGLPEAEAVLAELLARGSDLRPVMDEIGAYLVSSTLRRFEREQSPAGIGWLPTWRGGRILRDTGRLAASITHLPGDDQVEVGTNVIYGRIHQFGGQIRPRTAPYLVFRTPAGGWVRTTEVTIPARPYLGVSEIDATEIVAILQDYLDEATKE